MTTDPLDRIFNKLDSIDANITAIKTEAAADRQLLASHLQECTTRTQVIHKRIDDIKSGQRWWAGKIITAVFGGGAVGAWFHKLFEGR